MRHSTKVWITLAVAVALYAIGLEQIRDWYEPRATWLTVVIGNLIVLAAPAYLVRWHMRPGKKGGSYRPTWEQYEMYLIISLFISGLIIVGAWQLGWLHRWPL